MEAVADALHELGIERRLVSMTGPLAGDVLVIDSYRVRADDRAVVHGRVVAAVDDLDRDLAVDLVIDPSPGKTGAAHQRASHVFAGTAYCLVGPGLPEPGQVRAPADPVRRVLVSLGGDDGGAMPIAARLAELLPDASVAATGDTSPDRWPEHIERVASRGGLGDEINAADLVVCAGGVTLLEALRLERPVIVVPTADNQLAAVEEIVREGAAVLATRDTAASIAYAVASNAQTRDALRRAAAGLIDGLGPGRVASALVAIAGLNSGDR